MPKPDLSPKTLRKIILKMAYSAQCAHLACAFSIVEIISALYDGVLNYDIDNPEDPTNDRFVLSKGHGCMALYAVLSQIGWIPKSDIENYLQDGSRLHGLAEAHIRGIECSSGSLGHGLPIAAGLALGFKKLKLPRRVYCLVGDGELQEGTNWEAIQFALAQKLSNLTLIIDNNGWQAMGRTDEILPNHPLNRKLEAFGFATLQTDGHFLDVLKDRLSWNNPHLPTAVIANTIKGFGVSFTADDNSYHYKRLDQEHYERALNELG